MDKICVYTCITGNYDNIKEIENKEKGIDYYCFTNNKNFKSNSWNIVYISDENLTNVELARKIKILGHETINDKYDILVWMDGAITFRKKIRDFVNTYLGENDTFVAFKHGERNNIHDEAVMCHRFGKESKEKVKKLLAFYKNEKYSDDTGLIESTVYIKRPKDKLVIETMKLWFDMILNYSHRDQLSFNYCVYKTGLNVRWINESVFNNDWFKWEKHNYKKEITKYNIHFGDINDYDIDKDVKGEYTINGNKYLIKEKVPFNVDKVYITITDVPCVKYTNLKIDGVDKKKITIYNTVEVKGENIIYNDEFIIEINKKYYKGDIFKLSVNLFVLGEKEKYEIINLLAIDKYYNTKKINDLTNILKEREKYIEKLWNFMNSNIIFRALLKIRRIINKNKRI